MAELHPGIEPLAPYLNAWGMSHQEEVLKASGYYRVKDMEEAIRIYSGYTKNLRDFINWSTNRDYKPGLDHFMEQIKALLEPK